MSRRHQYRKQSNKQARTAGEALLKDSIDIIHNTYYQSFAKTINELIDLSRKLEYQTDKLKLFELQLSLFEMLTPGEEAVTEGGKLYTSQPEPGIHLQRTRNKYLNIAFRQIADSIAWRELGFDRFNARVLAQGRSAGHIINKAGSARELNFARDVAVELQQSVLINDVTNCLLVGDITCISKSGMPYVFEVKNKQIKSAKTIIDKINAGRVIDKKQEPRLVIAQTMLFSRKYRAGSTRIPVFDVTHTASDHMPAVHKILREATTTGTAGALIAPYLYVEAVDLSAKDLQLKDRPEKLFDGTPVGVMSNYDRLVMLHNKSLPRSHVPYANFPFDTDIITKLIMGTLYVSAYVIEEPLVAEFAKHGWQLQINKAAIDAAPSTTGSDETQFFSNAMLFPDSPYREPDMFILRHSYDGFIFPIFGHIMTMLTEFTSVEYIATMAHELHINAHNGGERLLYPLSISDRARWI